MAQNQIQLVQVAAGLTNPLGIEHAGDERLFVVERNGLIKVIDAGGNLLATPFLDISDRVQSGGERGLLGLAFAPNSGGTVFYVNYTRKPDGRTRISRFTATGNTANISSEQILLEIFQPYENNNGGQLKFGPDNYLYIATGDGGAIGDPGNRAQNPDTLLGKILRIAVNNTGPYSVPPTNPFVGVPGHRGEIWHLGLANPWRFSFDRLNGDMWIGDVGYNSREEIDFAAAGQGGKNFGWRCYEGNLPFNTTGCQPASAYDAPLAEYDHTVGCAITGGYVYRGTQYPALYGRYIFVDYCSGKWFALDAGASTPMQIADFENFQFSSLGENAAGELYVTALGQGKVYKVTVPVDCAAFQLAGTVSGSPVCNGAATASIGLDLTGGTAGYAYAWSNSATTAALTNLGPGAYAVTVTDANNCTVTGTFNVDNLVLNQPVVSLASGTAQFCIGQSAALSSSGAPAGAAYQWFRDGQAVSGATSQQVTVSQSGSYTVQHTNGACVSAPSAGFTITVIDPGTPTVSLTAGSAALCPGQTAVLQSNSAPANFTYQWFLGGSPIGGATGQQLTATQPGAYTVRFIGGQCNSVLSAAFNITSGQPPAPSIVLSSGSSVLCPAGPATVLQASAAPAGFGYQWFRNGQAIAGATNTLFTVTEAGDYTVQLTNGACSSAPSPAFAVTSGDPGTPTASVVGGASTTICPGAGVALQSTAAPAGYGYQWLRNGAAVSGATGQQFTATQAGTYTVQYTGPCASLPSAAITVAIETVPTPVATVVGGVPTAICIGSSVSLQSTAAPAGYGYQWSRNGMAVAGATRQQYVASLAGAYTVQFVGNCTSAASTAIDVTVNDPGAPALSLASATGELCSGTPVVLQSSVAPSGYTYQWFRNNVALTGIFTQQITATTAGAYTVQFTSPGCTGAQSTAFNVTTANIPQPTASVTAGSAQLCTGEEALVAAATAPAGFGYQWFRNGLAISGATMAFVLVTEPGQYTVQYVSSGCFSAPSAPVVITVEDPGSPSVSLASGSGNTCDGQPVVLQASAPPAGYSYQWYFNGAILGGSTGSQLTATTAGAYTVVFIGANCTSPGSPVFAVTTNPPSQPTATLVLGTMSLCGGDTAVLESTAAPAGFAYQWFRDGQPLAGALLQQLTVSQGGAYAVRYVSGNCESEPSADVIITNTVPEVPVAALASGQATLCAGESAVLEATPAPAGYGYQWYAGGVAIAGATTGQLTVSQAGQYAVQFTNIQCNSALSEAVGISTVSAVAPVLAIASGSPTLCPGDSAVLESSTAPAGYTYQWYLGNAALAGATGPQLTVTATGYYSVRFEGGACPLPASDSVLVSVEVVAAPTITQFGDTLQAPGGWASYQWLFEGQPIAGATSGQLVIDESGQYTLAVTSINGCPYAVSEQILLVYTEQPAPVDLTLYLAPNPTAGEITVRLELSRPEPVRLTLFDARQRMVQSASIEAATTLVHTLDLHALPAATYFLRVETSSGVWVRKVVKVDGL